MSQIPEQCKVRALQGALALAIAPWLIALLFLFLGKLFLSALIGMREVLVYGGGLIAFGITFSQTRGETAPRLFQSAIPAVIVGFLMHWLVEASKSGLTSVDASINSVSSSFLSYAFFGGLAGAVLGAAIGYYEYSSGNTLGSGIRRAPPRIIDHQPPRGLTDNTIDGVDALTREPLSAARGIFRCQSCSRSYHVDTIQTVSNGECAGCHSRTFTRVS